MRSRAMMRCNDFYFFLLFFSFGRREGAVSIVSTVNFVNTVRTVYPAKTD